MSLWSEALTSFEAYLRQSGLADSTVAGYMHDMRRFLLWLEQRNPQGVSPAAFTSGDVEVYRRHLGDGLGRSPASINRFMQSVRKFGRFVQVMGMRSDDPAEGLQLLTGVSQSPPRVLTDGEIERLVEACNRRRSRMAVRDEAILHLLLQTGMRAGELVTLRLADVERDGSHALLNIRSQRKRPQRRLGLSLLAGQALDAYLSERPTGGATHLFLSRSGGPLSIRSVQQIITSLGREAGLDISAKTLRSTCAARLWQATGDLNLLAERLGVGRPETVLRYISPLPGARADAAVAEDASLDRQEG